MLPPIELIFRPEILGLYLMVAEICVYVFGGVISIRCFKWHFTSHMIRTVIRRLDTFHWRVRIWMGVFDDHIEFSRRFPVNYITHWNPIFFFSKWNLRTSWNNIHHQQQQILPQTVYMWNAIASTHSRNNCFLEISWAKRIPFVLNLTTSHIHRLWVESMERCAWPQCTISTFSIETNKNHDACLLSTRKTNRNQNPFSWCCVCVHVYPSSQNVQVPGNLTHNENYAFSMNAFSVFVHLILHIW